MTPACKEGVARNLKGTRFQKLRGLGENYRPFKTQSTKDVETGKLTRYIKPSEEMVGRLHLEDFSELDNDTGELILRAIAEFSVILNNER